MKDIKITQTNTCIKAGSYASVIQEQRLLADFFKRHVGYIIFLSYRFALTDHFINKIHFVLHTFSLVERKHLNNDG